MYKKRESYNKETPFIKEGEKSWLEWEVDNILSKWCKWLEYDCDLNLIISIYIFQNSRRPTNKQQKYKSERIQKEKDVTIGPHRREKYWPLELINLMPANLIIDLFYK